MGTDDIPQPAAHGALATAMANLERTQRRFPEGQRRIFLAALDAFAERGFHATTTRDIAARAGLSPAGLYVHFGSKEEVLHQISVSSVRLTHNVVSAAATAPGTPVERLAAMVRDLTVWHAEHAATVRIVLHHLTDLTPEHRTEVTQIQQAIYEIMAALVTEGAGTGDFDVADPGATTLALTSLCVDTARWYQPGYRRTPAQIGEDNATAALRVAGVLQP
ncbi:TetR/AcrR family transcriptional regulator [Nocardia yamanashiensis]|uniref:TetR/AcrR family transcriptional regulator n=1 Tax=Nocardia yamanashiensis TaxID=209247 RepID=UPI001E360DDC|nr:TetR/AcrR family transcriptional regulator [Nocardia yamanashiensis]UGT44247.1 TetR/AcrR family transcriptional regulator [Nocardia yamanashiensis]